MIVTSGASGALESACGAYLRAGDEVLVFAPFYPYHANIVRAHGAVLKPVVLDPPDWTVSSSRLAAAVSPRTKLLLFANPSNPTGKVFSHDELEEIANVCREHDLIVVVDEVYEYLTYDDTRHVTLASLPGMFQRTLTISSAGKTFFVTGWRVGWIAGPADSMTRIAAWSDRLYVCAPAPLQHAIAAGLDFADEFFHRLRVTLDAKRRALLAALTAAGLDPERPQGAYYVMARHLSKDSDDAAADELVARAGVGSVPGSAFYDDQRQTGLLRFCFAVEDSVLADAAARLVAGRRATNTNVHGFGGAAAPGGLADAMPVEPT
jgi:aminotransferase